MAKQGHTPGPWEAKRGEDPQWNVWAEKQAVACTAHGNDEANARLIAAAPDLLATCEWAANMERIDPLAECCY